MSYLSSPEMEGVGPHGQECSVVQDGHQGWRDGGEVQVWSRGSGSRFDKGGGDSAGRTKHRLPVPADQHTRGREGSYNVFNVVHVHILMYI